MKKLLLFIVVILITQNLSAQLPLTGLQAWYPFCGNSLDQSGNGFDLASLVAPSTLPTIDTDRFGNPNTAYLFNGATSSLAFPVPFLVSVTTNAFTYSCWIKPFSAQTSVVWFNGDPATDGFGVYMNNGTLGLPGTNVEVVFGGAIGQYASTNVALNVWHHLVLTKIGGAFHFFVDGADHGFVAITPFVTPSATSQFVIGQDYTLPGLSAFNGKVDDMAIYNQLLSNPDTVKLDHFDPDVAPFTFGNSSTDTTICTNTLTLTPFPAFDTTNFIYSWSTGATPTTTAITVTPPGVLGLNYSLIIYTKPSLYGCSSSYNIHVHHLTVGVNIGPRDTTFCTSGFATLNPFPVAGETFTWSNGATTGSIPVSIPNTYWVVVDSAGCTGTDTTTVVVQDTVIINLGKDTSSCDGSPIVLQSNLVSGAVSGIATKYTWGWDNGMFPLPGITTNQTYTVTTSGIYWVVDTIGKCFGVDTITAGVVFDTLRLLTRHDTAICTGQTVPIRANGNPFATNLWTPTAGIASALSINPIIAPDTSSWYKLTASLFGCSVSDSIFIDVQPKPSVYIGGNRSVCRGDTIHIHAIVTPSWYTHYIYNWSPGINLDDSATTVGDSVVSTVVFTAGDSTDLIIIVKTPADNGTTLLCRAVDSAEIMVHTPHLTVLTDTSICPGDSVLLNANPLAGDNYAWHPGTYLNDSNLVQPLAKPITTQFYWVYSTDQFGCLDTMTENIRVLPGAVIDLGDSVTLYPGETYQISPQTNCVSFSWRPPLGLSDTAISNPIASPVVNTKFIVRATTEWGCYVTDSINIHVDPSTIVALPNAFTPGTGINNYLFVLKRGIAQLNYIRIFNRWGNKVYESNNIDAGWDGTYNGKPQPLGVYVYDLEAVTDKGVIFQKTGNVTLIR